MARPENEFPTIQDAHDALKALIDRGFGELPMQLVIVPASTLAVLAKAEGHTGDKPAIMIEMMARDGAELGVMIAAVEGWQSAGLQ